MVSVPLVADVIQPADVRAVAREHPVAPGPPEEAKAMCARLVGRSCELGTAASLEGGAVVIKTGRPALAFG